MIKVIGDSHVSIFQGKDGIVDLYSPLLRNQIKNPPFEIYRLGAPTATGISNWRRNIDDVLMFCNKSDKILFSFGEIDCRAHLPKEIHLKGKDFKLTIEFSVNEYFKTILHYKQVKGWNVCVLGPSPSHFVDGNFDVTYGTNIQRNIITSGFNKFLEEKCNMYSVPFVCLFDEILTQDGRTNPKYMDGWVHLNKLALPLLIEELKKKKII